MKDDNPWARVQIDPKTLEGNPYLTEDAVPPLPTGKSQDIEGICNELQMPTYGKTVHEMRRRQERGECAQPLYEVDSNTQVPRQLTFKETIRALVDDYNSKATKEEKLRLFQSWKDTCCGIAYKAKTTKFKIIPMCRELITIDENFSENYLPCDYDSLQGIELDSSNGKYSQSLSSVDEVLSHEAWLTAMENDNATLKEFADIVFKYKPSGAMGFYPRTNTQENELRALFVLRLVSDSNAVGSDHLFNVARFLLVAHNK